MTFYEDMNAEFQKVCASKYHSLVVSNSDLKLCLKYNSIQSNIPKEKTAFELYECAIVTK